MEDLELVSFKVISAAGAAKSAFMEAMKYARNGEFAKAQLCIEEGELKRREGHEVHFGLIQKEASGDPVTMNLLLTHAEDQLMGAETIGIMSKEILENHKAIARLEERIG